MCVGRAALGARMALGVRVSPRWGCWCEGLCGERSLVWWVLGGCRLGGVV